MTPEHIFERADGGETHCYGELREDSNFDVVCEDEEEDGVWPMRDPDKLPDWHSICMHLEAHYNCSIEELSAV